MVALISHGFLWGLGIPRRVVVQTPGTRKGANTMKSKTSRSTLVVLAATALMAHSLTAGVTGNIHPLAIEIDASANLYPSGAPGFTDWVKDSLPNTDTPSLINSVATGIIPGVTGAATGKGHWCGVRIVDGIAGNDKNIFLTGGKENDISTWNIGPGTVGSSKYDITQAYLANNNDSLFFGMERRGNNGTTAFDFEFNKLAPVQPLVPNRSVGDVLFTFEMNGSGTSGSAVPHYFVWDGTKFVEQTPAPPSLVSSINQNDIQAAPWGFVNSKGTWALGNLLRFTFAEASINLAEAFPNLEFCNGAKSFVQVRTRSSASDTSDLKDTTQIFEFLFGGPNAVATLNTGCDAQFTFDGTDSHDSSGGTQLTYSWDFTAPAGVTLSGAGVTGPNGNGVYHSTSPMGAANVQLAAGQQSVTISAKLTVTQGTSCTNSTETTITVLRPVAAGVALGLNCQPQFTFDGSGSTSGSGVTYKWDFTAPVGVTLSGSGITGPDQQGNYHSTALSGTVNVNFPAGVQAATIFAKLTVTRNGCTGSSQASVSVLPALKAAITEKVNDGNALAVILTGQSATSTGLQWQILSGGNWVAIPGATGSTFGYSNFEADSVPSVRAFNIDGGEFAGKLYQVTVRLHAERIVGNATCEANSAPLTLKKVIAVDP